MRLIDERNAEAYLRETGRIRADEGARIIELAGGVSNVVLLVTRLRDGESFVLKQAREQLRVAQPWHCSVERIWREVDVLRVCESLVRDAAQTASGAGLALGTPRLEFEDRENYCFAMSAAPPHTVWKEQLLDGATNAAIAAACGRFLAILHGRTWGDPKLAARLGDKGFFEDLRVDPFYRRVQEQHDDLREVLGELIESVTSTSLALVHGDFSPKNLLVHEGGVMLVDFEVGHFGDPAFDLGFLLSHLLLKAIHAGRDAARYFALADAFRTEYEKELRRSVEATSRRALYARGVLNLGACLLARVDGKSPVEYLSPPQRDSVRRIAKTLLAPGQHWDEIVQRAAEEHAATRATNWD